MTNNLALLVVMAVILGAYWAVGSNLIIGPCQELTDGAGFTLAHQQMFGIAFNTWLAEKLFGKKKNGKEVKKIDDIELPGFMSIFNEKYGVYIDSDVNLLWSDSMYFGQRLSDSTRIFKRRL